MIQTMEVALTLGSLMTEWFAMPCDHRRTVVDKARALEPSVIYAKRRASEKPVRKGFTLCGRRKLPAVTEMVASPISSTSPDVSVSTEGGMAETHADGGSSLSGEESGGDDADPEIDRRRFAAAFQAPRIRCSRTRIRCFGIAGERGGIPFCPMRVLRSTCCTLRQLALQFFKIQSSHSPIVP